MGQDVWNFFRGEDVEPVEYGLTKDINTHNPIAVAVGEYLGLWRDIRAAEKQVDKLRYFFLAPGWHHSKEDRRSNILRARD